MFFLVYYYIHQLLQKTIVIRPRFRPFRRVRTTLNLNPTAIPAPPPDYLGPRARRQALLRSLPRVYVPLHGRKDAEPCSKRRSL